MSPQLIATTFPTYYCPYCGYQFYPERRVDGEGRLYFVLSHPDMPSHILELEEDAEFCLNNGKRFKTYSDTVSAFAMDVTEA